MRLISVPTAIVQPEDWRETMDRFIKEGWSFVQAIPTTPAPGEKRYIFTGNLLFSRPA